MPACASEVSGLLEPVLGDGAVGDDGGADARPQGGDAAAQRWQHVAADHDVIGAIAERDIDGDGIGMLQGRGHGVALSVFDASFVALPHSRPCSASMHSSTIFSCGTSRDQIVMSAC